MIDQLKEKGGKTVMMHKSLKISSTIVVFILLIGVAQAGDWPMFQHDSCHTGYTSEVVPDNLELIWTYKPKEFAAPCSPVVADGKVFVSSTEKIYCLYEDNGDLLWEHEIGFHALYYSTPAIANERVFVGSWDAKIYCLDEDSGELIWSYKTGNGVQSSPTVANDKVFVGSNDGKIYCLDEDNGNLIWSYQTGERVIASPAVAYGKIFVGSMNGMIYCLNEYEGDLIWSYKTEGDWVQNSPVVGYGKVFVTPEDGNIYCLDVAKGDLIWRHKSPECDLILSAPAIADKKVFVSTKDGNVLCLDVDSGGKIWGWNIGLRSWCSPTIANEKIFIGLEEGEVQCLNRDVFKPAYWIYRTDYQPVYDPPAIADGKVFINWGGEIHCFGESTPTLSPTPTPAPTLKPTPSPTSVLTPAPPLIDSDGDGVPDRYDYAPYDPKVQSKNDIKTPGFEAIFAIAGLLAVADLLRRR